MIQSLETKLMVKYRISQPQAEALVKVGLGYPHLIKEAKKTDLTKIVGQAATDKLRPPVPKAA